MVNKEVMYIYICKVFRGKHREKRGGFLDYEYHAVNITVSFTFCSLPGTIFLRRKNTNGRRIFVRVTHPVLQTSTGPCETENRGIWFHGRVFLCQAGIRKLVWGCLSFAMKILHCIPETSRTTNFDPTDCQKQKAGDKNGSKDFKFGVNATRDGVFFNV